MLDMIGIFERHGKQRLGVHFAMRESASATALSTSLWASCEKGRFTYLTSAREADLGVETSTRLSPAPIFGSSRSPRG